MSPPSLTLLYDKGPKIVWDRYSLKALFVIYKAKHLIKFMFVNYSRISLNLFDFVEQKW